LADQIVNLAKNHTTYCNYERQLFLAEPDLVWMVQ